MTANASYDLLSSLLPTTPFALAYALPLLLVSTLLTFAGAFLTLDRTRVFSTSTRDRRTPQSKPSWRPSLSWPPFLRGGLGGLCSGYAFGLYFSTLLAVLIPNTTTSSELSPKSFLAVWILAVVICMLSSGRWNYATLLVCGITGCATAALSISVITHPTLVTRIALLAVLTTLGAVSCLLPFPHVRHVSIRFACASAGSFGLVVCIAILKRSPSWGNVWERIWLRDGDDWGTSEEKGLSAAYCLLLCAGLASDTFLHHRYGENPDEKWDHYLAKFATNLPNDTRRAGTFTPFVSLYDRILGRDRDLTPIVSDEKFATPVIPLEKPHGIFDVEASISLGATKPQPGFLRKKGTVRVKGARLGRRPVKFQSGDEELLSSSDEEDYDVKAKPLIFRSMSTTSSATLTNSQVRAEQHPLKPPSRRIAEVPDYSDYEDDLGIVGQDEIPRDDPSWTPQFIRRHSTRLARSQGERPAVNDATSSPPNERPSNSLSKADARPTPLIVPPKLSVPATPSLIKAVDRITAAYAAQGTPSPCMEGLPIPAPAQSSAPAKPWDTFWADVKAKAQT